MFDELTNAVIRERQKIEEQTKWLNRFRLTMFEKDVLEETWVDKSLIHPIDPTVPKITKIAGVDGGIIAEEMSGFDLILYRAVGVVFSGVGVKVFSDYFPSFEPLPQIFFSPSLSSRFEFSKLATLMRLHVEYIVAKDTIQKSNPTIVFLDGKVSPLLSDFTNSSSNKLLQQAEMDVKQAYRELIEVCLQKEVLLCGIVKDSRSTEFVDSLTETIPNLIKRKILDKSDVLNWTSILPEMRDELFGEGLLKLGERTSWKKSSTPSWLPPHLQTEIHVCLVKPVESDRPVRLEIVVGMDKDFISPREVALSSLVTLSNHGLPLAIPSVILEADDRTKLRQEHLDIVIDQISMTLNIPKDQLRKRRHFTSSLDGI